MLTAFAVAALLLAGTAYAGVEGFCRQCHGDPPGGSSRTVHHEYFLSGQYVCDQCHYPPYAPLQTDCALCHGIDVFAAHPSCLTCHANQVGGRRAVGVDFMASSTHVQTGAPPTVADCQVCHDTTLHMQGTVKLRSADDGSTITYSNEASATGFCLSCHDDNSKTSTPFSDARTPVSSDRNWDGKSVKVKYSTTEVVSSNKYPPTAAAPNMGANYNTVPNVQRALSAHGNPGQNMANGNPSDSQVPCLACHNSHGSPVAPLLFSTNTYVPQNMESFCWDCHTNDPASPQKASNFIPGNWVKDYFGDPRWGLNSGSGFTTNWMGSFAYKNSSFMSSHFYPSKDKSGTTWPRNGITCTDCHDPHGVDPGQTATKAYMVPLLKGTWLISPYKEDRAPLASYASPLRDGTANSYSSADQPRGNPDLAYNNTPNPGGGYAAGTGGTGHEGFFIDDNTFGTFNPANNTAAVSGSWKSVIGAGQTLQMNRIAENDTLFAGLCLRCHKKTDLQTAWAGHGTVKGWGGAKRDLFPSSVVGSSGGEGPGNGMHSMAKYGSSESEGAGAYGRGYRWGVNPDKQKSSGYIQTDYHQFPCSKCHSPHATNMPRLLTTNCLDSKGGHTSYSKAVTSLANNCHSTQRNLAWNVLTPWIQSALPVKYTITASSNSGGTISPVGASLVDSGTGRTFTMAANSGFALSDVKVDGVSQGAIASYSFSNVTANHTINATFVSTSSNLTISASAGTGGTISPSGNVSVAFGASRTFTITPNSGYAIADVKVDNVSQGAISTYTFSNVKVAHTISATFAVTRNITASAGTGGTISPSGVVPVANGASQTFTITPNLGYKISQVTTDGTNRGAVSTYTFTNVTTTHTISATFATTPIYTLTASAGAGGTISPAGGVQVNSGSNQTFTITPNDGYHIVNVTTDGTSRGAVSTYEFTNVTANHTISATFAINTYTLSANVGTGGTITPIGNTVVNHGASQTYTIAANFGYAISSVTVDGVPKGPISSYTFTNVTADHTISATLSTVDTSKTIVASAATGGTISPSGHVSVPYGASQTFSISANYGYAIADVKVDDISQGAIGGFTFMNVTAPHSISVTYVTTLPSYPITATAGAGGTIAPLGTINVWQAGSQSFNIYPNTGYAISNVAVDGVSQGAISTYTFSNVAAPHSISATFVFITPTYTITASAGTGGTISPSGSVVLNSGANQTFAIAANTGYAISNVTVDGASQGAISSYVFSNVTANHTISATFTANQPPVANAGSDKTGTAGSAISFTGSGSDSDGTITGYSWNWGDGSANTNTQNASHTYATAGTYTATLTVTDNLGATGTDTALVTVSDAPAGVAQLDDWTNLYSAAPSNTSATNLNVGTVTVGSGLNRLLLVAVVMELSSSANKTVSASLGGTSLTQVALTANSQREIVWVGRFTDAQIGSGAKTLTITYGGSGTVTGLHVKWASYSGVNQSNPVLSFGAQNTATTSATFASTINYAANGMTVVVAGNGGSPATGTLNATPSFTAGTATTTSSHTSRTFVTAKHTAAGSYSSSTAVSWSGTTSSRSGLVVVSLEAPSGPPPPNQAPVANAGSDKTGNAGSAISFTGSGTDSDGTIASYSWNWGDGSADTPTQNASHTYAAAGTYTATLTVTDNQGATGTDTATVTVTVPPPNQPPVANAGPDQAGTAGSAISFSGSASDPDGTITGYSWNWGDGTPNTTTQNASHTYATAGTYTATLVVTDNLGAIGSDTAVVTVSAAPAGVAALNSWTNIYTAAPGNSSATNLNVGSVTVGSGSNRLLLVAVVMELKSSANKTVSASLGGTSLTQVALTANSQREIVWVGRFTDAQIGSGAKTLTITYGGSGTVNGLHVKWASYSGVNQSNPVADSSALNTSSTSSTTFGSTVDYVNGGMTMVVAGNGGSSATGTLSATPSFTAGTATQANSHTSRTFVTAKHTANGSYSSSTAVSWSSGSTGSGLVAVSLQP